jgi:hypothetical protein
MIGHHEKLLLDAGFVPSHVETQKSVIYILEPELRIVYCNAYWDEFARANGGERLQRDEVRGTSVLEVTPHVLKSFYREAFQHVQRRHRDWEHDFECSSAEVYRLFHMRAVFLGEGHVLLENSLRVERGHGADHSSLPASSERYVNKDGIVTMCMHCRRTKRMAEFPERLNEIAEMVWDWVPAYVETPPRQVSHGLCRMCYPLFFD